ncbi:DNase I-like protein, partial [Favolaschia claudopus]
MPWITNPDLSHNPETAHNPEHPPNLEDPHQTEGSNNHAQRNAGSSQNDSPFLNAINNGTRDNTTGYARPPENETEDERIARYARDWEDGLAELRAQQAPQQPVPQRVFPGPATARQTGKKNTKASVKVAALNIKGNGNPSPYHPNNKWWHIWQIMREERLGVLVTTESHLDGPHRDAIHVLFGRKLKILVSPDPDNPTGARGVAFVLHRDKVQMEGISTMEIIPGRAMILNIKQHNGEPLSVLGVYAPNTPAENAAFWNRIGEWYEANPRVRRPDLMGGDTNIVESALDRLPARTDPNAPVEALDELKIRLGLIDGWRETNPTTRAYTYLQKQTGSQSRIDRMYIRRDLFDNSFEWGIKTVGIETDHRMISVRLTCDNATQLGHGRWSWPKHLNDDPILKRYIDEKGKILKENIEKSRAWEARVPEFNPQHLWACFKSDIVKKARERSKVIIPKMEKEIADYETRLNEILGDQTMNEEERKLSAAVITEKIVQLEQKRHRSARLTAQIRNRIEGEVIGKYWTMLNKPAKPREVIHRLRITPENPDEEPTYETNSKKMATMARNYHNKIQ